MEGPDQPRDRIRWRGERTTIERTRIATPHSSWIESYTETESTAIDELSLSPPAAADESPPKWNKQPKNPTKRFSLTRQRKKRTNGIRTGNSQNHILSKRARKKGRSFLDRGWGRYLHRSIYRNRNEEAHSLNGIDRDDRSRPMEVESVTLWQPKNTV